MLVLLSKEEILNSSLGTHSTSMVLIKSKCGRIANVVELYINEMMSKGSKLIFIRLIRYTIPGY